MEVTAPYLQMTISARGDPGAKGPRGSEQAGTSKKVEAAAILWVAFEMVR